MALSTALYSGVSGLGTLGNAMQIIGDNIANVNTVAFKGCNFNFQDLLSQSIYTLSGSSQVGRGSAMGSVSAAFDQGTFESTASDTDLAINGDGFFVVRDPDSTDLFYSRAGNFHFDKDGYLINPEGYVVQGWQVDANGQNLGAPTDVQLVPLNAPPLQSDNMKVVVNLDSNGNDNSSGADDSLATAWDGTQATPLAATAYDYQTTLKVYDSLGNTHDITIYFDKAATTSAYEFIVSCNVSEDNRTIFGATDEAKGVLARGLLEFDSSTGEISDIDLWQFTGTSSGGDGITLSAANNWTAQAEATDLSNGYFTLAPTFISGNPMAIELNFGSAHDGTSWVNETISSTQYARTSTTSFQSATGYGAGDLRGVSVDVDGVLTGAYSNRQSIPHFRVAMANFLNEQGLAKMGGNLYSETPESGIALINNPGSNGLGSVVANALEQSNVDLANEFVKMITTQRGFQANSKIITVTDQMMAELLNLKR